LIDASFRLFASKPLGRSQNNHPHAALPHVMRERFQMSTRPKPASVHLVGESYLVRSDYRSVTDYTML